MREDQSERIPLQNGKFEDGQNVALIFGYLARVIAAGGASFCAGTG